MGRTVVLYVRDVPDDVSAGDLVDIIDDALASYVPGDALGDAWLDQYPTPENVGGAR